MSQERPREIISKENRDAHSRRALGQLLPELGPVKFITGIRLAQESYRNGKPVGDFFQGLVEAGLITPAQADLPDSKEGQIPSTILFGYSVDREQWDQALKPEEKREDNHG